MSGLIGSIGLLALSPLLTPAEPAPARPAAALFQAGAALVSVVVEQISFFGDCPGTSISRATEISLRSDLPPCPDCRVQISNPRTDGYTDREYKPPRLGSEPFSISLGERHHQQFLSLQEGSNPLRFSIRRGQQILAEGELPLELEVRRDQQPRDFITRVQDTFCDSERWTSLSNRTPLSKCRFAVITQLRGVCPGGQETVLLENRQPVWRRH